MIKALWATKQAAKDFFESSLWPRRPQTLNVEITAACDARCIHCPRLDMDRAMKAMPLPLFQRLVDQCEELGIPYFCPNGYGEICTVPVPALTEYFEYLSGHLTTKILINTNGHRMNEERAALFIKHRVHLINVTIDGATAATAEAIRVNLSFDTIEANIKRLLEMRRAAGAEYPKVRVGMIAMPQTIPEIPMFLKRWEGVADFVGIGGYSSRLTSVEKEAPPAQQKIEIAAKPASRCVLPFRDLNVWADGKAVLCCEDWNEEYVVGDLNTQTLDQIWHGPEITKVRRMHIEKRGGELAVCGKCNNWAPPSFGARLWS